MHTTGTEAAKTIIECLLLALEWERIRPAEVFDQIACRLRRNSHFYNMPLAELDLLLADAIREFQHDMDEFESRFIEAVKHALGFNEIDGVSA
jgi:hypothetical protein